MAILLTAEIPALSVSFLSLFISCLFLSLRQDRAFMCIYLQFRIDNSENVAVKVASAVYESLIKHAKISQSQSLLELFK